MSKEVGAFQHRVFWVFNPNPRPGLLRWGFFISMYYFIEVVLVKEPKNKLQQAIVDAINPDNKKLMNIGDFIDLTEEITDRLKKLGKLYPRCSQDDARAKCTFKARDKDVYIYFGPAGYPRESFLYVCFKPIVNVDKYNIIAQVPYEVISILKS